MGFAVVLWGAGGWRIDAWFGLAAAFALIAMSDAIYVAAQLGGGWTPGTSNDLGYAAGSLLIAARRLGSRRTVGEASPTARVALPIAFTVTAFLLVVYEAFTELDPVAVAMIRLTLLAVVVRLGLTLWWLSRQRADLEALAASDPLTGLRNHRACHERLQRAVAAGEDGQRGRARPRPLQALNDTLRPRRGRPVLAAAAERLRSVVRERRRRRPARRRGVRADPARRRRRRRRARPPSAPAPRSPSVERRRPRRWRAPPASPRYPADAGERRPTCSSSPTPRCTGPSARAAARRRRYDRAARRRARRGDEQRARDRGAARDARTRSSPVFQPVLELATGRVAGYEALARIPTARPRRPTSGSRRRTASASAPRSRRPRCAPRSPCPAGRRAHLPRAQRQPAARCSRPRSRAALPEDLDRRS